LPAAGGATLENEELKMKNEELKRLDLKMNGN